jgi:hypothetical protein
VAQGNIDLSVVVRNQQQLSAVNRQLSDLNKRTIQAQSSSMSLGKAAKFAAGALATIGVGAAIRGTINAIRTFEDLKATLVTIQGDAERAAQAFDQIAQFTATTTFQLDEVSRGFITLRNAGLNPTIDMMTELGNIAAGMGKGFDDVARAVFNATTGEFEMLKQLGIKVKTEGDNITATFRGTQVTMKKDADSIVAYLRSIGKEDFAGAIEARSKTLTGSLSNLGDAVSILAMRVGEAGLTASLTEATRSLTAFVQENEKMIGSIGKGLGDAVTFTTKNIEGLTFAVTALFAVFGKSPVGRVISALTAMGILAQNIYEKFQQAKDAVEAFIDDARGIEREVKIFYDYDDAVGTVAQTVIATTNAIHDYDDAVADANNKTYRANQLAIARAALIKKEKQLLQDQYDLQKAIERDLELNPLYSGLKIAIGDFDILVAKTKIVADAFVEFRNTASSELTDVIMKAKSLDEALGNIVQATIRSLIQGFINLGITIFVLEPLQKFLRGVLGRQKQINNELKREIALRTVLAFFGGGGGFGIPFFANGGRTPANQPIIVGERGPELFIPNTAGEVVPNNEMMVGSPGGGGGGDNITVTFNINTIDATDFNELLTTRQDLIIGLINRGLAERGKRSLTA